MYTFIAVPLIAEGPITSRHTAAGSPTVLAGPLDGVTTWVSQWGTGLQLLGGAVLAVCIVIVGIKLGAKATVSSSGGGSGHRDALGAIFGLAVAGVLIGAGLILAPIFIGVGSATGTP